MTSPLDLFAPGAPVALAPGDCVASCDAWAADAFDAVVTDPPYHLASIVKRFGAKGAAEAQEGTDGLFRRSSKGFMGREWDGGDLAFRPETWAAFLRVTKPGGHLIAFNHSRTWHHMAVAIEAAGWEIRDSLMWLYGSGFPKSHSVSAGIDKLRDDRDDWRRITAWIARARDAVGLTNKAIDLAFGFDGMAGHWTTQGKQPAIPTPEQWSRLLHLLGVAPADVPADVAALFAAQTARKGEAGEAWQSAEVLGVHEEPPQAREWAVKYEGGAAPPAGEIKAANSPEAQAWVGWGTALKPAFEPIVLARKPLTAGSVARQHLATGTGGINVEACRVPPHRSEVLKAEERGEDPPAGRWPANVVHDGSPEVVSRFPVEAGVTSARFFYSGKATAEDRQGSEHPTVKPDALMRWLVRLVAPRGATILDPFGGSGATGWAAAAEGVRCVLCEAEGEYLPHLRRRIEDLDPEVLAARLEEEAEATGQKGLF
ncbi:MAG: DNA methyltransferase [Pseudomonadota bacterium]